MKELFVSGVYLAFVILFLFLSFYFFVKEGFKHLLREIIDTSSIFRSINDNLAEIKTLLSEKENL